MDVKVMVAAYAALGDGSMNVSQVCRELGISRGSFYRVRSRVEAEGMTGLLPRSSRPRSSPNQTGEQVVAVIVAARERLRREGWDAGARSIQARLSRDGVAVPSARTVHRVLVREGLVDPAPAKRPRSSFRRFEHPAPNACWQIDGTWWPLADATLACIVRVVDDHSRLILATRAAPGETTEEAWAVMETAMQRHGRPVMVLSDGGSAFTSRRTRGGVSVFEQRLRDLGINPVVSSPYHPQTCGKKEREWQPLKRWLTAHPDATNLAELQRLLDTYDALFNTERPHQALAGATPAERYDSTAKAPPPTEPLPPPITTVERRAYARGRLELGGGYRINLGKQWTGATLTVVRDNLDVAILHNERVLKRFVIDPNKRLQPSGLPRGRTPNAVPSSTS